VPHTRNQRLRFHPHVHVYAKHPSGGPEHALSYLGTYTLTTAGYMGNGGGSMASLCDVPVIVPSKITMNVQESHLALEHILRMVIERFYFGVDSG